MFMSELIVFQKFRYEIVYILALLEQAFQNTVIYLKLHHHRNVKKQFFLLCFFFLNVFLCFFCFTCF